MHNLINPENPVMRFFGKVGYSICLNLLWFILSLPVVTAGAATTALFTVTLKMAVDEDRDIFATFFRSFRDNFRQSTLVWLILLAAGIILGIDGYVLWHMRLAGIIWTVLLAAWFVMIAGYGIILMYVFPLMARFNNTNAAMIKNALMIGMRFLIISFIMAVIYLAMGYIAVFLYTPVIFLGEGFCALLCSYLLKNVLAQCEQRAES